MSLARDLNLFIILEFWGDLSVNVDLVTDKGIVLAAAPSETVARLILGRLW
jgi:hypothetical protein